MWSRLLLLAVLLDSTRTRAEDQGDNRCGGLGTSVVVLTDDHRLWLCEDSVPTKSFRVSLGTGGVGKHTKGDSRTPLGSYLLGQPNKSAMYYIAISVGYPTREQAKQGFTGDGIAIHGPLRLHRKANGPQTKLDWTRGCIALGTDAAIAVVADWVKEKRPRMVHIF